VKKIKKIGAPNVFLKIFNAPLKDKNTRFQGFIFVMRGAK